MDIVEHVFLVSKAVTRAVVEKSEEAGIALVTALAAEYGNGAFDGWVFEFNFLLKLRLACAHNGVGHVTVITDEDDDGNQAQQEQWAVERRAHFFHAADLDQLPHVDFGNSTWYIPRKVNQGAFDVVLVTSATSLRFVQVTVANHHSRKLKYLRQFGRAWENATNQMLTAVELVAVVPSGQLHGFTWGPAVGTVPATWNIQYRVTSFVRTGAAGGH